MGRRLPPRFLKPLLPPWLGRLLRIRWRRPRQRPMLLLLRQTRRHREASYQRASHQRGSHQRGKSSRDGGLRSAPNVPALRLRGWAPAMCSWAASRHLQLRLLPRLLPLRRLSPEHRRPPECRPLLTPQLLPPLALMQRQRLRRRRQGRLPHRLRARRAEPLQVDLPLAMVGPCGGASVGVAGDGKTRGHRPLRCRCPRNSWRFPV